MKRRRKHRKLRALKFLRPIFLGLKVILFIFIILGLFFISRELVKKDFKVNKEDLANVKVDLEPGDIIIQRRDYRLSNPIFPGYWKHSYIYTGNLDELNEFFNGEELLEGRTFSSYLKLNYPEIYEIYSKPTKKGHEINIMEATTHPKWEASLESFEEKATSEMLSALRPRVSKARKLEAVLKSYTYLGNTYDFLFDYSNPDRVACSEVPYHAYKKIENSSEEGISFYKIELLWMTVYPPNEFVQKFDEEYNTSEQELDFVFFADGDNKTSYHNIESFRKSWQREDFSLVKWMIRKE